LDEKIDSVMRNISKIALFAVGDSAWQGGIQYITNIIGALDAISQDRVIEVHLFKKDTQQFNSLEIINNLKLHIHDLSEMEVDNSFLEKGKRFFQRKIFKRLNPRYENYFIKNNFDFVYPAVLSDCNGKLNVGSWIADFQYYYFPNGHTQEITKKAEKTISFIAHKMPKVVFSSNSCLKQAETLFPMTKGKSFALPFAVSISKSFFENINFEEIKKIYNIKENYFIVSNLFAFVKNHKTIFQSLAILREKGILINVVCTGNLVNYADTEFTNEIIPSITKYGINGQVYLLGLIPRLHQISLYRSAIAMIQPSLHEGWSTCVEEAKFLGKSLILSDIDVHKEQFPDNPNFFKAEDPKNLSEVILKVYQADGNKNFPDIIEETAAINKYKNNIKEFGHRIMSIAEH